MKLFLTQLLKEFKTLVNGFNPFVIFGAYYIISLFSAFYLGDYFLRESEIMNAFFSLQPTILLLVIPAITMRTWAEEFNSGTSELLLTQPIAYSVLVLSKFFAVFLFFTLLIIVSSAFLLIFTAKFSVLDWSLTFSEYLGLLLCGALFIALGCFISSLCKNNVLSYISTIFVLFFLSQIELSSCSLFSFYIPLSALNFEDNYNAFLEGVIQYSNFIYFIVGTILFLWLNTISLEYKKSSSRSAKKLFSIFTILILLIFFSSVLGINFVTNKTFDITDTQKFTLSKADEEFLQSFDKRIDLTLYEAQFSRQNSISNYAVYANFVERILRLIEKTSYGAIRVNIVQVEPFSPLENHLIREKNIPFETDKFDHKIFMAAELSDNSGQTYLINYFDTLRENLLVTDILRAIKSFGLPKKEIALISSKTNLSELQAFQNILQEFFTVTSYYNTPNFLPNSYKFVIAVSPQNLSTEQLLALEQYVLQGGNLIVFAEPSNLISSNNDLVSFLNNFGLSPIPLNTAKDPNNDDSEIGAALAINQKSIRSILVNQSGEIKLVPSKNFELIPLLKYGEKIIAAQSSGNYFSNFINLAISSQNIVPFSTQKGSVFFIYDTDLIKDYLISSSEANGWQFYQLVPMADNMLFLLQLFDSISQNNIESSLSYRFYALNTSSIGNAILNTIRDYYTEQIKLLEQNIEKFEIQKNAFYENVKSRGFASIKNIGDISSIEQNLDESETELYKIKSQIAYSYQSTIMLITICFVFVIPFILLCLLFLCIWTRNKLKLNKIRSLINDSKKY